MQKKTHEEFLEEVNSLNFDIEIISKYVDANTKVKCRCNVCGYEWESLPRHIINGVGCYKCYKKKQNEKYRKKEETFIEEIKKINPDISIIGNYINCGTKILCKCNTCEYEWETTPNNLLRGRGCPKCGGTMKKNTAQFINEMSKVNSNIVVLGEYVNSHTHIKCICKKCNYTWNATPTSLLSGSGCPNCSKSSTSFMEQFIVSSFRYVLKGQKILSRDKTAIGKELDIYIPSLSFAVEPGSWSYHKNSVENDSKKRELCKKAQIKLITIYDAFLEKTPPFSTDCLTFGFDLGSEKNHLTLKNVVIPYLFKEANIYKVLDENDFCFIEDEALQNSLKIDTKGFIQKMKSVNPSIEIKGKYLNSQSKIKCSCLACGNEWYATPSGLIQGHGCPKCSGNYQRTQKEFIEDVAKINPNIKIKGEFVNTGERILCQCKICGYEWSPIANSILRGHRCPNCCGHAVRSKEDFLNDLKKADENIILTGDYKNTKTPTTFKCNICKYEWTTSPENILQGTRCPKCSKKRTGEKLKKSHSDFIEELKVKNPYIEVLGDYKNAKTPILCRCKLCGNEWLPTPNNLLRNRKCPICHCKVK